MTPTARQTDTSSTKLMTTPHACTISDDFILTPPAVFPYKEQQLTARARITEQMASRILMLDGAMGTQIQNL